MNVINVQTGFVNQYIRASAPCLIDSLVYENAFEVLSARTHIGILMGRFYEENKNLMASQQYEAPRKYFEYFLLMVEVAIEHAKWGMGKK